ncbi:MAG: 50S ribosomal protein L6, partial [Burkholderiaceae bacterium]
MSRIAKYPVPLPKGVEATIATEQITVKGPLGTLTQTLNGDVLIENQNNELSFKVANESREAKAMSGTLRALVSNMVQGVSQGFEKKLSLIGVGYKAAAQGKSLNLSLGFSHPVDYALPEGIKAETPTPTEIVIKGIDKQRVGQVAAEVRAFR